ncbi:hypothetical protein N865_05640 [Intrasporangium oryzae NRRL B-24470]|uniref:DUF1990 domain-containing protein n=1 Tax=Intrasporangium oryzae NRRL B-24470 TaxID=1386089 RepID=W9G8W0_9MICO|nr:DUF1990 domain-containing protein [Intrasporangium oryzae]EWT01263.1 hypothetical protein N865_05640 [Intrasporangium oryzae NRRL B-24470]
MPIQPLDQDDAAALREAPLSYSRDRVERERTRAGFRHLEATARLERRDFDGAVEDLLRWRMHERAGLRVHASDATARLGSVAVMRLGVGPFSLRVPCRVVEVLEEPTRKGFAYGTLPGHPESGEEAFVLDHLPDGAIQFTITAFSRPASLLARLGGPMTRGAQQWMTRRYLASLDHP